MYVGLAAKYCWRSCLKGEAATDIPKAIKCLQIELVRRRQAEWSESLLSQPVVSEDVIELQERVLQYEQSPMWEALRSLFWAAGSVSSADVVLAIENVEALLLEE
jgi:hypothetical protein